MQKMMEVLLAVLHNHLHLLLPAVQLPLHPQWHLLLLVVVQDLLLGQDCLVRTDPLPSQSVLFQIPLLSESVLHMGHSVADQLIQIPLHCFRYPSLLKAF